MRGLFAAVLAAALVFGAPATAASLTADQRAGFGAAMQQALAAVEAGAMTPSLSIAVFDAGGVIWSGAAGFADADRRVPASPATIYRAGSISKLVTAALVMQDVAAGRLALDTPVAEYLPEFRPKNPFGAAITVRHLVTHRSGLVREAPVGSYFEEGDPGFARITASLAETRLVTAPGAERKYSNAGYAVLGHLLERVGGRPFEVLAGERVLRPAGMNDSGFSLARADLAYAEMAPLGAPRSPAPRFAIGGASAGGLFSNVLDLARLGGTLLGRRLVDDWPDAGKPLGFDEEVVAGEPAMGHGGAIYGYTGSLYLLPARGVGVAVLGALEGGAEPGQLAEHALKLVVAASGDAPPPAPLLPLERDAALCAKLEGYYLGAAGSAFVRSVDGGCWLEAPNVAGELRRRGTSVVLVPDIGFTGRLEIDPDGRTIGIDGVRFDRRPRPKPAEVDPALSPLVGYYRRGINEIIVYERDGRPYVNVEWSAYELLRQTGPDRLDFPDKDSMYARERLTFSRDAAGRVTSVDLSGIGFARFDVEGVDPGLGSPEKAARVDVLRRAALTASPPVEPGPMLAPDLVDLRKVVPGIRFDIRYATSNNFLGTPVYRKPIAFLQRPAALALGRAAARLAGDGLGIVFHDGYRPWYVTKIFWDITPAEEKIFVADPAEGSRHNRAAAADVSLFDLATGLPAPTAAAYDETTARSYPLYVGGTDLQRWRRDRLTAAMLAEGFDAYAYEWWHFDYRDWRRYPIQNVEVDR